MTLSMVVCCCDQLDVSSTGAVDKRFDQSLEINSDLKAESVSAQGSYSFYVAADPHVKDTHVNLSIFNNALRNDSEASFVHENNSCGVITQHPKQVVHNCFFVQINEG